MTYIVLSFSKVTALEMLGHRESNSNNRYLSSRYDFNQVDEDEDLILQRFQFLRFCLFLDFKIKLILFRVLAESLNMSTTSSSTDSQTITTTQRSTRQSIYGNLASGGSNQIPFDLSNVLEMSKREEERREQLRKQEDEELERILQLSLLEK